MGAGPSACETAAQSAAAAAVRVPRRGPLFEQRCPPAGPRRRPKSGNSATGSRAPRAAHRGTDGGSHARGSEVGGMLVASLLNSPRAGAGAGVSVAAERAVFADANVAAGPADVLVPGRSVERLAVRPTRDLHSICQEASRSAAPRSTVRACSRAGAEAGSVRRAGPGRGFGGFGGAACPAVLPRTGRCHVSADNAPSMCRKPRARGGLEHGTARERVTNTRTNVRARDRGEPRGRAGECPRPSQPQAPAPPSVRQQVQ